MFEKLRGVARPRSLQGRRKAPKVKAGSKLDRKGWVLSVRLQGPSAGGGRTNTAQKATTISMIKYRDSGLAQPESAVKEITAHFQIVGLGSRQAARRENRALMASETPGLHYAPFSLTVKRRKKLSPLRKRKE